MAFSRYARTPILDLGKQFGTSRSIEVLRAAVAAGTLQGREVILRGAERLDTIAGTEYGDGRYWWIIAACSNIGWGFQVPAGTILLIPKLSDVAKLIS